MRLRSALGALFKSELAALLRELLSDSVLLRRGLPDLQVVACMMRGHGKMKADSTAHLLALVRLKISCRIYLDGQPSAHVTDGLRESVAA